MGTDHNTIDDLMPDPEAPQYVAIIECEFCGHQRTMFSTDEPRDTTYWDCDECGADDAPHHSVMKSNTSQTVEE
jgi:uncharacterized Zn finger protein